MSKLDWSELAFSAVIPLQLVAVPVGAPSDLCEDFPLIILSGNTSDASGFDEVDLPLTEGR